jgi:hypothetical protein
MTPDQQWHWGEGTKYAIEGMKALLLLNGGAAIALLTFIGNHTPTPASKTLIVEAVGNSLISFGGGTAGAAMAFVAALHDAAILRERQHSFLVVAPAHLCAGGHLCGRFHRRDMLCRHRGNHEPLTTDSARARSRRSTRYGR